MAALPDRDSVEARLLKALAKANAQTQRRILDALGTPPNPNNVSAEVWGEIETLLRGAIVPELEATFMAAAEATAAEVGIGFAFDVVNTNAATWANNYGFELVRGINDNSRRMLQESIGGFFETPLTNQQLQEKLGRIFGPRRSEAISITEVTRAATQGELSAVREIAATLREGGLQPVAIWITANDSLTCVVCGPRNEKRQGDGWTDPPPAHPRCRCGLRHEFVAIEGAEPAQAVAVPTQTQTTPVREAFTKLPEGRVGTEVNAALDSIGRVHATAPVPEPIPVRQMGSRTEPGRYRHYPNGAPFEIEISSVGRNQAFTFTHETGHFLDHQAIGTPRRFASTDAATRNEGPLVKWWQTVQQTPEYQRLVEMRQSPSQFAYDAIVKDERVRMRPDARYVRYLLEPEEVWARSYAQYVTNKTGTPAMRATLADDLTSQMYGSARQWSAESFSSIESAMDDAFKEMGWM